MLFLKIYILFKKIFKLGLLHVCLYVFINAGSQSDALLFI